LNAVAGAAGIEPASEKERAEALERKSEELKNKLRNSPAILERKSSELERKSQELKDKLRNSAIYKREGADPPVARLTAPAATSSGAPSSHTASGSLTHPGGNVVAAAAAAAATSAAATGGGSAQRLKRTRSLQSPGAASPAASAPISLAQLATVGGNTGGGPDAVSNPAVFVEPVDLTDIPADEDDPVDEPQAILQRKSQELKDKMRKQAEEIKKAIERNIRCQMTYEAAFSERLQGEGMEVQTSVPNVSQEVLKILGIECSEKQTKDAHVLLGGPITKVVPDRPKIVLKRDLSVKYYLTTGELRIEGYYAFEECQKNCK